MFRSGDIDFCVLVKYTYFKYCDVIIGIGSSGISTCAYFFFNPKHSQKKVWANTSMLRETFLTCFWLNTAAWRLVPGRFMILSK